MIKTEASLTLGTLWILLLVAVLIARFAYPWADLAEVNDEAMAIFDAPYSMALRNGVFNVLIAASVLGLAFTLIEMPKPALIGTAALILVVLAQLFFVDERAHEYEATHPFDHTAYVDAQNWKKSPIYSWGQTAEEDLDMVYKETLLFMGTIQYQMLGHYTKKFNDAVERAHKHQSERK